MILQKEVSMKKECHVDATVLMVNLLNLYFLHSPREGHSMQSPKAE